MFDMRFEVFIEKDQADGCSSGSTYPKSADFLNLHWTKLS